MATINISIPDELQDHMERFKLDWPSVALAAFRQVVMIETYKERGDLDIEGIVRLRASRGEQGAYEEADGVADGRQWALSFAEYDELKRVASIRGKAAPWGEALFRLIGEAGWYDEQLFGERDRSGAYAAGFVKGAGEVFDKV